MGPLPGWWLGEDDGRKGGPLLNVEEWDLALKQADFSGVELDVRGDCDTSLEPVSLLVSTKTSGRPTASQVFAIIKPAGDPSNKLAAHIETSFQHLKSEVSVFDWTSVTGSDIKGKYCVCLSEWANPLLATISDEDWNKFRTLVSTAGGTLWVTGGAAMECSHPHGSLMVGLSRAIRNENSNCLLATLDIDPQDSAVDLANSALAIRNVAVRHSYGDLADHEFAARGQTVYIPRVERAPHLDSRLRLYQSKGEPEEINFVSCQHPLKLTIQNPGLLDSFVFEQDTEYYEALPEDWVEIQVKAVGLNFKDVLVALGNLNENKLGVDVSGVVTRVGSAVSSISVGDRVMTSSCNTFATFVRFPMQGVIPIPDDMSFEDAASMPLIFLTAYYALVTVGRLQPGETVLIHAAAGGVGQAAIAIAQHIGAEIYATVGSPEKRELLIDQYCIPDDHIFSSRDTSFAKGVMRATNGLGVGQYSHYNICWGKIDTNRN